jgi:hypothetical protein
MEKDQLDQRGEKKILEMSHETLSISRSRISTLSL